MNKFCIVVLLLLPISLFSNDIRFNKFGTKNGLSNESAYKVIEDNEGFIWIGTYDGLDRFDGERFKSYKPDEKDSTSIPGNMILDLQIDNDNNLWIATNQGICMYNKLVDRFERKIKVSQLDSSYVKSFIQDRKGNFWITKGKYAVQVGSDYKLIQVVDPNPGESESDQNSILYINEDLDGQIWLVVKNSIYSYDPKTKSTRQYTEFGNIVNFYGASIDSYGNVWLGNYSEPVVYIKEHDRCYSVFSPECPIKLPRSSFSTVFDDKKGNLWFSALGNGLFKYNVESASTEFFQYNKSNPFSIAEGAIEYTFFDKKGNIWCVGNASGLSVSYKDNRPFNVLKDVNLTDAGIFRGSTTAMIEDSEGNIWFGTEGHGICVWNPVTQNIKEYKRDPNNPKSIGGNGVYALFMDSKGFIWAGGYNAGLSRYNPETDNFISFGVDKQPPYTISCMDVRSITEDPQGNIWVVTCCGGVNVYNPITFEHEVINVQNNGILNDYDLKIYLDDKNQAWIGTYSGLTIYNIADKSVKNFTSDKKNHDGLPDPWVYCIYKDKKDRYWIGTQGGLALFDEKTEKFKSYTENNGLPNKTIMSITEDDSSNLWIATTNGIYKFDPEKESFLSFSTDDGLPDIQFRMNAAIKTSNGKIYMGSKNGILYFDPFLITQNKDKAPIFFTDLYINNKYIQPGKSRVLKNSINYTKKIKLKHNENFVRIDFVELSYFHAEKNTYAYKLEGVDEDWVNNGTDNSASYTNLKHGNYTFYVKAFNSDGYPSDIRSLKVRIKPVWYNTLLFYIILIVAAAYGIFRYIKTREIQSKHDKHILESKIAEGEKVLNEKMQLLEAQQKEIQDRDFSEKEIKFHNEGIAKFSDIFGQKRKNVKELSASLISELVKYIGANAGLVFVADDSDPQNIILRMEGEFCYDSTKERKNEFLVGEGYVGTCYKEMKPVEILDLPDGTIVLNSGLGQISLSYNIFVPVIQENNCLAVLEIAALESLPKYKISFIEKIADNFSSVIAILRANEKMEKMLSENITQSEILKAQEEELRQNLEEMHATQEDLRRQMESAAIAQQKLEKEKVLINTFLKYAKEMIYFKDKESRFIKLSDSMAKLFKVKSVEELYGKSDFDFFTEEHARPAFEDEMEIIKTGVPIINKVEKETHADGRITYVSTSKMPLYDHNMEIIGTFGISKDITDMINMEIEMKQRSEELQSQDEELRQNLEEMHTIQESLENQIKETTKTQEKLEFENIMFSTLMDNITARITYKDKKARYIRINKMKADALGMKDQSEVIGKTDLDVFVDTHTTERLNKEIEQIRSGVSTLHVEELFKQKDGIMRWGDVNRIPLKNKEGEIVGGLVITWDITDNKNREFQLEQISYLVKSFAENMPVVLFKANNKGDFSEIEGNGLALLNLKNTKNIADKIVELFPGIKELVVNEKSKEIEEISGKVKLDKTEFGYKTILIKSKAISDGYAGYILLR